MGQVDLYKIRGMQSGDVNFVFSTFLKGLYYGSKFFRATPKADFMRVYHGYLEQILRKNIVKIACDSTDPDIILGFSIVSPDEKGVHYVFVKEKYRTKFGVFRSLMPVSPEYYTHETEQGRSIAKNKYETMVFNPFKL